MNKRCKKHFFKKQKENKLQKEKALTTKTRAYSNVRDRRHKAGGAEDGRFGGEAN